MSLAVTCLSGLTLRAGGLAIRGRRRSSAHNGGKPSTGHPQPAQLTSELLAADVPPPQRSFPIHTHNARLDICQKITPKKSDSCNGKNLFVKNTKVGNKFAKFNLAYGFLKSYFHVFISMYMHTKRTAVKTWLEILVKLPWKMQFTIFCAQPNAMRELRELASHNNCVHAR